MCSGTIDGFDDRAGEPGRQGVRLRAEYDFVTRLQVPDDFPEVFDSVRQDPVDVRAAFDLELELGASSSVDDGVHACTDRPRDGVDAADVGQLGPEDVFLGQARIQQEERAAEQQERHDRANDQRSLHLVDPAQQGRDAGAQPRNAHNDRQVDLHLRVSVSVSRNGRRRTVEYLSKTLKRPTVSKQETTVTVQC